MDMEGLRDRSKMNLQVPTRLRARVQMDVCVSESGRRGIEVRFAAWAEQGRGLRGRRLQQGVTAMAIHTTMRTRTTTGTG